MIDFVKEKNYSSKNMKLNIMKHTITLSKFRIPKFVCSTHCNDFHGSRLVIYFGMTNGNIIALIIYRQKHLFKKYDDFILYKCPEKNKHDGAINSLITLKINQSVKLISAGVDGEIKLWVGDPEPREKDMIHYIDTLYKDNSTIIELLYSKKRNILIGAFSDIKIKILQIEDIIDSKKNHITKLTLISVIDKFNVKINPAKDKQYLITSLSLKESDITELYVSDNKGKIMTYHYVDDNYMKYQNSSAKNADDKKLVNNCFNYVEKVNLHKTFGVIKVIHNNYDNIIYTCGYDNHIICYNCKNQQKIFDILSSNTKTHITTMILSNLTKELIIGDDFGNVTFIDIFNKSEFKYKAMQGKILSIQQLKIFEGQEHMFFMTEDFASIFRIIRKTKVSMTKHHDAEIMRIFVAEPSMYEGCIVEDSKIISIGYDNKIKIWDFLTMECLNEINGPELPKVNIEISSVCFLKDSELIAIGTEVGHIFFWDLNKSEYIPITYEEKYNHKGAVTDIISFMRKEKNGIINKESMLSCSTDGLILFWEVNKVEIKEIKRKNQYNYDESDEFILKKTKYKNNKNAQIESDLNKFLQTQKRKELKIFKCSPGIKKCINTLKLIKTELKFNTLAFQTGKKHTTIFSGINDNTIYLWDYDKEKYISKIKGTNSFITCMIVDYRNNFLLSGGIDGLIDVWSLASEDKNIEVKLIQTISDPDITKNNIPRINDLLILPKINIWVISNNNKKLYFFDVNRNQITHTIKKDNEITCICCLESYGKLLCGSKQKMIIEINLNSELSKAGYNEIYDKYPFTKNKANYEESEIDKYVNNFKIMKSLTQDDDEVYNIK